MKSKQRRCFMLSALLSGAFLLAGCGNQSETIHMISREDGSGTQGAFIEIFDIEDMVPDAEITNSTSVMITSVSIDQNSIGYISLGSMSDMVKAVDIDGIEASTETVQDGTYPVKRPFLIVENTEKSSDLRDDFVAFVLSGQGQEIVEENDYVSASDGGEYTPSGISGTLTVGGSSSVTPVMEKLAEAYMALNPSASIQVQQSDSSTGISGVMSGTYDLGMSSRNIKDAEKTDSLQETTLAWDGIAVIVNKNNPADNLSREEVKEIYEGTIQTWSALEQGSEN